jgi:hypothetical protein
MFVGVLAAHACMRVSVMRVFFSCRTTMKVIAGMISNSATNLSTVPACMGSVHGRGCIARGC